MRVFATLIPLALLAACGTPQQNCIAGSTRELSRVDALIAEVQQGLSRGYALEETVRTVPRWVRCEPDVLTPEGQIIPGEICLAEVPQQSTRMVPIDPAAEKRKLAGLQEKRRELARAVEARVRACKAQFPE